MASSLARNVVRIPSFLVTALLGLGSISVSSCGTASAVCGDARVEGDEECDDGNTINTDNCTNNCKLPQCGDGVVQQAANGEQCEDADYGLATRCPDGCAAPKICKLLPTPTCVDAPSKKAAVEDTDGCTIECKTDVCGDGYLYSGAEECDDGNNSNTDDCLVTCLKATCGDAFLHQTTTVEDGSVKLEECDDGNDVDIDNCTNVCALPKCGDKIIQVANGEQCDDGNDVNDDACPSTCKNPTCGDGFVDPATEECDDGNAITTDACLPTCKKPACGDGFVQAGVEECDDGNLASGDYCSPTCKKECFGDNAGLFEGRCYMYYPGPSVWAPKSCNAFKAHLVTIDSTGENTFVQSLLPPDATNAWIGLSDQASESAWFWQLDEAGMNLQFPAIKKWAPGQPDDMPAPADCAMIDRTSGLWYDQTCTETRGFVCEHEY